MIGDNEKIKIQNKTNAEDKKKMRFQESLDMRRKFSIIDKEIFWYYGQKVERKDGGKCGMVRCGVQGSCRLRSYDDKGG